MTRPSKKLETFPNPEQYREYVIDFTCPEFTCVCPKTGQPDFATIRIRYVPAKTCVELKSLKLYLWSFRDRAVFAEAMAADIAAEIFGATDAAWVRVTLTQRPRGGITLTAVAERRP